MGECVTPHVACLVGRSACVPHAPALLEVLAGLLGHQLEEVIMSLETSKLDHAIQSCRN